MAFTVFVVPMTVVIVLAASFFSPAEAIYVLLIPAGLSLILFTWYSPYVIMLILVALIPMASFASLSETTGQFTLFKLLFPLPLCVLGLGIAFKRFEPPLPHPLDGWIFCWMLLNLFLIPLAADKMMAAQFCRKFVSMGLFYFVLTRLFCHADKFYLLIQTIIFSTLPSAVIGFYTYLAGSNPFSYVPQPGLVRVTGPTVTSPNDYVSLLFLPIWLAVSNAMSASKKRTAIVYLGIAIIIAGVLPLTYSRSGILAFAITASVALMVWRQNFTPAHWMILLAVIFVGAVFLPLDVWERMASLDQMFEENVSDYSLWRRMNYLKVAWNIVKDYPFFGAGPGNFRVLHMDPAYQTEITLVGISRLPHNMYLQVVTETGIMGLIAVAGVAISSMITTSRGMKGEENISLIAKGLFLALTGLLVMGAFAHLLMSKYFWLLLAMIRVLPDVSRSHTESVLNLKGCQP